MAKSAEVPANTVYTGVINFVIHRVNFITSIKMNSTLSLKFANWDTQSLLLVRNCYGDTYTQLTNSFIMYITVFVLSGQFQQV